MKLQVIGDPVLHSLSPVIHSAMLAELGLDATYTAHVVSRGGLPEYLAWAAEHGVEGFNATMPHKEALIPLLDEMDGDAVCLGAVNTVCLRDGKWVGHNTDGAGCLAALEKRSMWPAKGVVVLGAGGAARAIARKLAASGAERVWVCGRTATRSEEVCALPNMTAASFDHETLERLCAGADLLINATSLGMEGQGQFERLDFLDALAPNAGVFDAVYHPEQTQLLSGAETRGLTVCGGLPMLIYQAVFAMEFFLDRPLDRCRMAESIERALKKR